MKSVCFTGHRLIKVTDELKKRLRNKIIELIENGAEDFYAGGAVGWDMLCEQTVLELRNNYPHIRLHIIMPCPAEEQSAKWTNEEKFRYSEILVEADARELVCKSYTSGCMKMRNQRLVELADCCVCYYNENISMCGTAQTVRMAQSKGIPVVNLYV
ncbi:MAG: DUF1273 family protein [Oscillospiraceae bacterium]|nr:DUF1273 family protein [Oscillospiraceae bacterium]